MGDHADDARDHELRYSTNTLKLITNDEHELKQARLIDKEYKAGTLIWTPQRKDRKVLVTDMDNQWLMSTIEWIKRKKTSKITDKWIEVLTAELEKR